MIVLTTNCTLRVIEKKVKLFVNDNEVHFLLRHILKKLRRVEKIHTLRCYIHRTSSNGILLMEVDMKCYFSVIREIDFRINQHCLNAVQKLFVDVFNYHL